MNESFERLLGQIRKGDVTQGTYLRHSVERNRTISFEDLIINTPDGLEFVTVKTHEYDAFNDLVKQQSRELRCKYYPAEECYRFEILGHWQAVSRS